MSGFEVLNDAGVVLINSDQKHTIFDSIVTPGMLNTGDYNVSTPFGNVSSLAYLNYNFKREDGYLYWIQFTANNGWGYPGANLFVPNSIRVIRTSRNKPNVSGYLDVFDANGNLVWSAASAATMPRIMGFLDVAGNVNLEGQVVSVTPGFNPFFLWNNCFGQWSDDGFAVGYSGNLMRWTGSQLQTTWIRNNQKSFAEIFSGRGRLKIPYARFQGYN